MSYIPTTYQKNMAILANLDPSKHVLDEEQQKRSMCNFVAFYADELMQENEVATCQQLAVRLSIRFPFTHVGTLQKYLLLVSDSYKDKMIKQGSVTYLFYNS